MKITAVAISLAAIPVAIFFACDREPPLGPGEARLTISGRVTLSGSLADSVEVRLAGETDASALTDSLGNYSFEKLANGLYEIKPVNSGFAFDPQDRKAVLSGADLEDQNFTMSQVGPRLIVQKETIDFGSVDIGGSRQVDLGLGNLGLSQLTVSKLSFSANVFSGPAAGPTILPDSLVYFTISFNPEDTTLVNGSLTITSNDPGSPTKTVGLSGRGILRGAAQIAVEPQNLDFGFVQAGSSSLSKLILTNSGSEILHISTVATTNPDFHYTLPSMALAVGRSLEIAVSFSPSDTGMKTAQLIIGSDASNSPNLGINLSGKGISTLPSSIQVEPAEIDFADAVLDTPAELGLTITNTGTDSLIVTALIISGAGFSTNFDEGVIIPPQGSENYLVRFFSSIAGEKSGTLTVFNSDPQNLELEIPLHAVAVYPPPEDIKIFPTRLEFGSANIGSSVQKEFRVINPTAVPLEIHFIESSQPGFSSEIEDLTVPAGDTSSISVTFAPEAEGALEGVLTLNTNVAGGVVASLEVSGEGLLVATGTLELSADKLDFGTVIVGDSRSITLSASNTGEGDVEVTGIYADNPAFTASIDTDNIGPGGNAEILVNLSPLQIGSISASLMIESTDPELPTAAVTLTGVGVDTTGNEPLMTVSSRVIEIGEVALSLTGSQAITIGNIGKDTLHVSNIRVSRSEFDADPKKFDVLPGLSQSLTVFFTPSEAAEISGSLVISSDDQARAQDTLQVSGIGVAESGEGPAAGGDEILIAGGVFLMGKLGEFEPVRQVKVSSFSMDRYEVTNQQFKEFMDAGGYNKKEFWTDDGWQWRLTSRVDSFDPNSPRPRYWTTGDAPWESDPYSSLPNSPVVGVSWYEAYAYAKFRNRNLPTEAQWEFAARGTTGRTYPWGDFWEGAYTNHGKSRSPYFDETDGFKYTAPVGNYIEGATPEGIHHLAGNVWEWCRDWFGAYNTNETINPQGPPTGLDKSIRGGSWNGAILFSRVYHRNRSQPHRRYKDGGIRLVKGF